MRTLSVKLKTLSAAGMTIQRAVSRKTQADPGKFQFCQWISSSQKKHKHRVEKTSQIRQINKQMCEISQILKNTKCFY